MIIVVITIILTLICVFFIINLSFGSKSIDAHVDTLYNVADPQFLRSMGRLLGPPVIDGNRIQTLVNGDEIFPSMLEAIHSARETVNFETFIYWSGNIGKTFADVLSERARAGVRVNVMLDWFGCSDIDEAYVNEMKHAGVDVYRYNPLRWYTLGRMNNRTHRKLLVIDGKVGFTGGVGIATQWTGHAQDKSHWRDTHFRIEGPAVAQLQSAFIDNWIQVCGQVLHSAAYFPPLEPVGGYTAQVFKSSPRGGAEGVQLMYLLSIAAAKTSV